MWSPTIVGGHIQTVNVNTSSGGPTLTPKWSSNYTFDADGRISGVTGTRPSGANLNESYTYNNGTEKLNRLTQATIDGNLYNYQYDPAGNMTNMSVPGGTNAFTYDADNRIQSMTVNGTAKAVTYDNNGNLTQLTLNGTTRYYTYDSANRLTAVGTTSGGSDIAIYTYDSAGNRLSKTVGTTTTTYHYFQGQLMYETVGTTVTAVYLRSSDGKLMGVRLGTNSYYYYHYNAQGDVTAVTDSMGTVYRQYVYDPYGNIISVKDGNGNAINISNDLGFNNAYTYRGYRYDSETGLYFLQSRYYSAGIGRFLTKDMFGYVDYKDPQTLNFYSYAGNNPVSNIDPKGNMYGIDDLLESPEGQELLDKAGDEVSTIGQEIAQEASVVGEDISDIAEVVDPNKINHIFGKEAHNLDGFLEQYGGDQIQAFNTIQNATQEYVDANNITGLFKDAVVNVNGTNITVRGIVINGQVQIGTAFIP